VGLAHVKRHFPVTGSPFIPTGVICGVPYSVVTVSSAPGFSVLSEAFNIMGW